MSDRACYRYKTKALTGPWRRRPDRAVRDALAAGQLDLAGEDVRWRVDGEIETSLCDRNGPCGGSYPPEDDIPS